MTYDQLLAHLNTSRDFPTLGGRSKFRASNLNGALTITNSSGTDYPINRKFYDSVRSRYDDLSINQKKISKNYTDPEWGDCPGRIQAPYLPAIWESI